MLHGHTGSKERGKKHKTLRADPEGFEDAPQVAPGDLQTQTKAPVCQL